MLKINSTTVKIAYAIFILAWLAGNLMDNAGDDFKYVFMLAAVFVSLMPIINVWTGNASYSDIKYYNLFQILLVVVVFSIVSVGAMLVNGFQMHMFKDLFYIFFPMLLCFGIINVDKDGSLDYYIDLAFFSYVIYFIYGFRANSITLITTISFADSYSPWESGMADVFFIAFYYYYVRNKKIRCGLAFIFNFLSFKRIHVVFSMGFLLFGWVFRVFKKTDVNKVYLNCVKVFFMLSPIVINFLVSDEFVQWFNKTFTDLDYASFTMGRFDQIIAILNYDMSTRGLGVINYYLEEQNAFVKIMHCDLLRVYLETTIIGLVVFVNSYMNVTKKNIYSNILVVFFFVVMFSSTCIQNIFYWFLIFMSCEGMERTFDVRSEDGVGDSADVQLQECN